MRFLDKLLLSRDPQENDEAATKRYVDENAGGGESGGPPKGHIAGANLEYVSSSSVRLTPGEAMVNGTLISWSSPLTASNISGSASAVCYVYLRNNSGAASLETAATDPVYDLAHDYWKMGTTGADASRRCVGYLTFVNSSTIRQFLSVPLGRVREFTHLNTVSSDGQPFVVNEGAASFLWVQFDLSAFAPVNATNWYAAVKAVHPGAGQDLVVGVSPTDLGQTSASFGPFTVRPSASATPSTFFGRVWLPISAAEPQKNYYRLVRVSGSPTANIECHGARIVA